MTAVNSPALRQQLQQALLRAAQLEGVRQADSARLAELTAEVAAAKGRLGLAEEVGRIFDALQQRAHERSVGAFERLLTAILHDVLPDEGVVRLLAQFKSNATWLDVALEKSGGLEDIAEGNGGAVTNVICAGLRFAALSRTTNRRMMVLDEPDCWLKPERVPAFVRVIAQVAAQTQTQTFFITHHEPHLLEGFVNLVKFSADEENQVVARLLPPAIADWPDTDMPGIRRIELFNFRRHVHTVVPCYPGATAFIGDNNLGKSTAIVSSFKAVAYGESDDSMIRHGCDEAKIVLHLEQGRRIEWSRSTKRSPTVLYRLFEAGSDTPVHEGRPKSRNQVPDWVSEILGVARVDDLDIQLGSQKSPVFLLNDSAPRRAQILSIGRESSHLKTFMKRYEELRAADREAAKQGELGITKLNYRLGRMTALAGAAETLASLAIESDEMLETLESQDTLKGCIGRLEQNLARTTALEVQCAALSRLPEVPVLEDTSKLLGLTGTIAAGTARTSVAIPELPQLVTLADTADIERLGLAIRKAQRRVTALADLPESLPEVPALGDTQAIQTVLGKLSDAMAKVTALTAAEACAQQELAAQVRKHEEVVEAMGGECPLCGSCLDSHTHEGVVEHAH